MRKSRYTDEQIIGFIKQADAGMSVADLCRRLLDGGAPELHFYTLNLAKPTLAVLERLR